MGIFSEIAEELEEKAYREGFLHGVFWPISLPLMGAQKVFWWVLYKKTCYELSKREPLKIEPVFIPTNAPHLMSYNDLKKYDVGVCDLCKQEPRAFAFVRMCSRCLDKYDYSDISISPIPIQDQDISPHQFK
jgi:hypothetical protein